MRRLLRDWWVLLPLTFGLLTWAAFLYVGIRARRPGWLIASFVYGAAIFVAFGVDAAVGEKKWSSTMAGLVLFALMGGGFAHALAIRQRFNAIVGGEAELDYDAAQRRLAARDMGRKMVEDEPDRARQMGVGRPDMPEAFDAELVDLNSAPANVIMDVARVTKTTAERIVKARAAGEFSSVEDLDLLADLPTDEIAKLRDAGVCVPRD
jgi:hypothetical protein